MTAREQLIKARMGMLALAEQAAEHGACKRAGISPPRRPARRAESGATAACSAKFGALLWNPSLTPWKGALVPKSSLGQRRVRRRPPRPAGGWRRRHRDKWREAINAARGPMGRSHQTQCAG